MDPQAVPPDVDQGDVPARRRRPQVVASDLHVQHPGSACIQGFRLGAAGVMPIDGGKTSPGPIDAAPDLVPRFDPRRGQPVAVQQAIRQAPFLGNRRVVFQVQRDAPTGQVFQGTVGDGSGNPSLGQDSESRFHRQLSN